MLFILLCEGIVFGYVFIGKEVVWSIILKYGFFKIL